MRHAGVDSLLAMFFAVGFLAGATFMLVVADGPRPVRCKRCGRINLRPLSNHG